VRCKSQRNRSNIIKDNAVHGDVLKLGRIIKIKKYAVYHKCGFVLCIYCVYNTFRSNRWFSSSTNVKIPEKSYWGVSEFCINEVSSFKLIGLCWRVTGLRMEVVCIGIVGFAGSGWEDHFLSIFLILSFVTEVIVGIWTVLRNKLMFCLWTGALCVALYH
jgi:hypothetical protein